MTRLFIQTRNHLAVGALLLAAACSDSDADATPDNAKSDDAKTDDSKDSARSDDGAKSSSDSAIMYALMIRDPDGYTDYLMAGKELPTGTLDTSRGLELPGGNYYADNTATYYSNFETKTLQRYIVDSDLEVKLDGEISLANYIGCTPVFFSAEKAFGVCPDDGLLFQFDPTKMEIEREIEVPELVRKGYTGEINRAERVGERILGSIVYSNEDGTRAAEDSTIAIAIDGDADKPLTLMHDDRAVSTDNGFVDDAGNFYVLAEAMGGYYSLVEGQEVQPKLLRVKHDAEEVDPDYLLDLGELFDTPAVNGLWPLKDTKFVVQVWRAGATAADADLLDVKANWEWHIVDAESRETAEISDLGRSTTSYSLLRFIVDKQLYVQQYVVPNEDYNAAHVELYKIADDGKAEKIVESTRGDLRSIVRVDISK